MDFLFELIFEILLEGLFSGLFDLIGRGVSRVIRVRGIRIALLALLAAGLHRSPDPRFAASPGREPRSWSQRLVTIGALNLVTAAGITSGTASV